MPSVAFDIANPETVAAELAEANRRLAREDEAPASVLALIADLGAQIAGTSPDERASAGVSAHAWIELQSAAMRAMSVALGEHEPAQQRQALRLRIEELRFRLARIAEREPVADERPIAEVIRWLDDVLSVPQTVKAELFGVHDRTYQRWVSETEESRPAGDDERRIRLVAWLVADLRHVLTAVGVVAWLQQHNAALDGRRPLDVIDDTGPAELQRLSATVAAARAGTAA